MHMTGLLLQNTVPFYGDADTSCCSMTNLSRWIWSQRWIMYAGYTG